MDSEDYSPASPYIGPGELKTRHGLRLDGGTGSFHICGQLASTYRFFHTALVVVSEPQGLVTQAEVLAEIKRLQGRAHAP